MAYDNLLFRLCGLGPDTIDFRFRFSAEIPALLLVAHTVSAESKTSAFGRPLLIIIAIVIMREDKYVIKYG